MQYCGSLSILWHCLSLGFEWKLLKPGLENFDHYLAGVWDECDCVIVWTFFGIAFLWDLNENWPFPGPTLWTMLCRVTQDGGSWWRVLIKHGGGGLRLGVLVSAGQFTYMHQIVMHISWGGTRTLFFITELFVFPLFLLSFTSLISNCLNLVFRIQVRPKRLKPFSTNKNGGNWRAFLTWRREVPQGSAQF